ncbi:uncharacterized protein C6orf226 homolog [Xyrichtys novacula]|uniref:Uncharacterized protein C6orf226 homolog n=1 Tax=Xyrichtys novacula TaxID=13765 RepID=A0AAV1HGB1_XYRNO|nr:uncharacterized protein C6orf226 homolog [Xyrichtys novacula]
MASLFSRFDSYDFESDRRFQDGLKSLNISDSKDENKLLDMKLFFYNRFVEPIDPTSYKQWSSTLPHVTPVDCSADQRTLSDPDSDVNKTQTAETSTETETTQLSFAEVMKLVQEGKEVPGAKKLDIKPTNQSPTPSQMDRVLKPWEISTSK